MDQNDGKITIQFRYINQFGGEYNSSSSKQVFTEYGESTLDYIGEQFCNFLRQCEFCFPGELLMKSLDMDELCYLASKLEDYRAKARSDE